MSDEKKPEVRSQYVYFALVIYPEEDFKHKQFLDYVLYKPIYKCCYIQHVAEDEGKKNHLHVLVKVRKKMTANSFCKFFDPWISYAEGIRDAESYILYMLHQTPHAIADGKKPYDFGDLHGDSDLWKQFCKNLYFVQFHKLFSVYRPGTTMLELLEDYKFLHPEDSDELIDFAFSHFNMVTTLQRQYDARNMPVYHCRALTMEDFSNE